MPLKRFAAWLANRRKPKQPTAHHTGEQTTGSGPHGQGEHKAMARPTGLIPKMTQVTAWTEQFRDAGRDHLQKNNARKAGFCFGVVGDADLILTISREQIGVHYFQKQPDIVHIEEKLNFLSRALHGLQQSMAQEPTDAQRFTDASAGAKHVLRERAIEDAQRKSYLPVLAEVRRELGKLNEKIKHEPELVHKVSAETTKGRTYAALSLLRGSGFITDEDATRYARLAHEQAKRLIEDPDYRAANGQELAKQITAMLAPLNAVKVRNGEL